MVGDIINSKEIEIDTREKVTAVAKNILNRINTENIDFLLADFGLVRGDAFEGVLLSPYNIPNIIQDIIKGLYAINKTKVRISVVLGNLTTTANDRNENDGPAFYKAFEKLSLMKEKKSKHWLQVSIDINNYAQPILDSALELLMELSNSWTDRQREIVWAMEDAHEQQVKVSEKLSISASVVNKQLKAASYNIYHQAWLNLEKFLLNIEESVVYNTHMLDNSYTVYYSVGQRKKLQQKYTEAQPLLLKAVELATESVNKNDPVLAVLYNGLAENLIRMKNFKEAKEYIDKSLSLQKSLPRARLEYANTFNILGNLYYSSDNLKAAKQYYDKAKNIALNTVGEVHPYINLCNNNIQSVGYK
jgi:tetratricopeptide (TPR) repeat protein